MNTNKVSSLQSRESLVYDSNALVSYQPKVVKKTELSPVEAEKTKDQAKHQDQFEKLVECSKTHLAQATTAKIPIDLFPDEIVVDVAQVTVIFRQLLGAKQVRSIPIRDVVNVEVDSIPLRATLRLHDMKDKQNPIEVSGLRKKEAEKVRRVIQGLIVAERKMIDLSKVSSENLADKVEILGGV